MEKIWSRYYNTRPHTHNLKNPHTLAHTCEDINVSTQICTLWVPKYSYMYILAPVLLKINRSIKDIIFYYFNNIYKKKIIVEL